VTRYQPPPGCLFQAVLTLVGKGRSGLRDAWIMFRGHLDLMHHSTGPQAQRSSTKSGSWWSRPIHTFRSLTSEIGLSLIRCKWF